MTLDLNTNPRLGMGCWAIGGPFWAGETPLGWGEVDDAESIRAIKAALDGGIRYFDTANVYGAGHSERILGAALDGRHDVAISTKIGNVFDEKTAQMIGEISSREQAREQIEASLKRLGRERIDLVFLHLNDMPPDEAAPIFDAMEEARKEGRIGGYGWSTDFPESVASLQEWPGFVAVQHTMNLWFPASRMIETVERHQFLSVNRMPLGMGVFSGKYDAGARLPKGDVRTNSFGWMDYFRDGEATPEVLAALDAVRELLQSGGRTLAQGALGWILARSGATCPIPGIRTEAQAVENAAALDFGPLPQTVMDEIEAIIPRPDEGEPRAR
ncbi:aldo/keto reductase [Tropicimonas sp. IMCC34043]|uniref:aldo/keto reductase n=1 Tax=Tropicimonas sp. IMCC34043 TaxID=2248760 RepID=UPI000E260632|nr:aldo/keto reductase [Tropicimonas sp. IMCC34043]